MANPNLDNSKDFLTPADKEFENNIRPAHIAEFSGQAQNFGWFDNMRVSFETVGVEGSTWSQVKARFE